MTTFAGQLKHLKKDKLLRKVIEKTEQVKLKKNTDLYLSLMRAIVGQQLSIKAAETIWKRFIALFSENYPYAELVLQLSDEKLRAAGLSYQKAGYIKNIAVFSLQNTLDYKKLKGRSDEDLIDYLVRIKGVGRWTAEMILMFNLNREDVFPKDDLGIQNGIIRLYGCEILDKRQLFSEMDKIAGKWRPYRTLACMYLWKYKDTISR